MPLRFECFVVVTGCLTSRNLGDFRRILKGPAVFNVWDQTKVLDISMWDIATKLASDWQVAKLVVSIYFWTPKLQSVSTLPWPSF